MTVLLAAQRAVLATVLVAVTGCGLFMSPERRVERAEKFIADGEWATAGIELRNALDAEPDNVRGRLALARVAYHMGDLHGAEKEVRRAVELGADPAATARLDADIKLALAMHKELVTQMAQPVAGLAEPERLTFLGYGRLGTGDVGGAVETFRSALALNPTEAQALETRTALASGLATAGQTDEAVAELDAVLARDPQYAPAVMAKSALLVRRGQVAEAERMLTDLKLGDANSPLTQMQRVTGLAALTEARLSLNEIDKAERSVKTLRSISGQAVIGAYLQARVALARNDATMAVTEAQRVVQVAPDFVPGRFLLAQALAASGSMAQAEAEMRKVVQSAPENVEARKMLADVQIRAGRPEAAAASLAPILDADGGDAGAFVLAGRARLEAGDTEGAEELWERSLESSGDDTAVKLDVARSYLMAGDSKRALEVLATVPDDEGGTAKKQMQLVAMATGKDRAVAREEVAALVKRSPDDLQLINLAAAWHASQQDYAGARAYLKQALEVSPKHVPSLLGLARVEFAAKDTAAARKALESVLEVEPANGPALLGLADLAVRSGDESGAVHWLEEWRKRDPKAAEPRLLLARRAMRQKDEAGARKLLDEALAAAPKKPAVLSAVGQVLAEAGLHEEALRRFREASELAPTVPEYQFNVARVQLMLKQREAARESLGKALAIRPDWAPAAVLLAQIETQDGHPERALALADRLKASPREAASGYALEGEIRMRQRQFGAAETAFAKSFELRPSSRTAIGRYQARQAGGLAAPDAPLVEWLAREPKDSRVRMALAEYRQATGDQEGATAEYEQLLAQHPGNAVVLNNLAWLYSEQGDPRAEDFARRAYEAAPKEWAIADTYGWVLVRNGKAEQGVVILQQAADASKNNPEVLYHLGAALAKTGARDTARDALQRAVSAAGPALWKAEAEAVLAALK